MKIHALAASAMAALLSLSPAIPAAYAETTLCTEISALPFTITVQGVYCLKQNLNVNIAGVGNAITINAGNVVIDFNGWRVNNQAPLATNLANGVYAQDRKNITLKNGFIRGFVAGVNLDESTTNSSYSHLVEGMKIADSGTYGILVEGDKSVIRDNRVFDTGGGPDGFSYGILLQLADDGLVAGNIVSGVSETGTNSGVLISSSNRVKVTGNEISGVNGGINDRAIGLSFADHAVVARNGLLNDPGTGTSGIHDLANSDNVVCRDNEADGFSATPFSGCDASDGNRQSFN